MRATNIFVSTIFVLYLDCSIVGRRQSVAHWQQQVAMWYHSACHKGMSTDTTAFSHTQGLLVYLESNSHSKKMRYSHKIFLWLCIDRLTLSHLWVFTSICFIKPHYLPLFF